MSLDPNFEHLRARAVESLFQHFADACVGLIVVDKDARIAWIGDRYLELLGYPKEPLGKPVEEVIPNSQMRHVVESGQPMLIDLMDIGKRTIVVTRLPLRDDGGTLIGAIGLALFDRAEHLRPLMSKYQRLQEELTRTRQELANERRAKYSLSQMIGNSEAMREVKRLARRAAQMDSTVLLLGETGTGKELLAHGIHAASPRANAPFVGVNVAAIPENLLEAELFGVAPGAYTGADRRLREGKFQLANGGTLFLDEIGDMPLPLQAKLLRVLQEREFEAVGSNKVVRVDLRIIAATSRDLDALVRDKQFRADLYYRLNVVPITLPPLRDRTEDIASIADRILDDLTLTSASPSRDLAAEAIAALKAYDWPGNVRELRNVLERVSAMTDDVTLTPAHIAAALPRSAPAQRDTTEEVPASLLRSVGGSPRALTDVLKDTERAAIIGALARTGGVKAQAAKLLGISRASLYERMQALGIREDMQGSA
ncbi:sigma-54 interaction domain-containing protein [Azospirillum canadense]|uniref:sigma-54 interaction domain-containing protein n=1 Tax=Azospirillum canadense TaxID=403962 RepID=UPI002226FDBA|nr:sigma 54-interacting transcriptional regulator [Azospirillum canadense]MCW2242954.1 transcriptional regulator with PAS, ATPase and Fis domain [Azospirillum canadense]